MYPLSKEDRKLRNKVEVIVLSFYIIGLILCVLFKTPVFILITALSIPFCLNKKIGGKLLK